MKKVLVTMVCACIVLQAFAKENCIKKVESTASSVPTAEKNMNVTEDCEMNVSLFHESVKQKNFADALEPWRATYKDCPSANEDIKEIYIKGLTFVYVKNIDDVMDFIWK